MHFSGWSQTFFSVSVCVIILFLLAFIAKYFTELIVNKILDRFIFSKTKSKWDDYFMKRKVFKILSHFPAAYIIYSLASFSGIAAVTAFLNDLGRIYFIFIFSAAFVRSASSFSDIYYNSSSASKILPIRGYIQLFQILVVSVSVILIIGVVVNKSIGGLLTGLGAVTAVLVLVFKDTILGFVASLQLSGNHMLKIGDWIEMPNHNADGNVIDITLMTVKVQNWDMTIATIPTYSMVSESFNNWTGMQDSGGRRVKRSINLDMNSVHFCDDRLLEKFSHFHLLKEYIKTKEAELKEKNKESQDEEGTVNNKYRQTNLGVFRKYMFSYLKELSVVNKEMTYFVRYLQPTERGLPVEFYFFSKVKEWVQYEQIQANIFDHILAILPEFELRVFQNTGGSDLRSALSSIHEDVQQNIQALDKIKN